MPEYLTPGVYVEETSFRTRSIEGVPTSTFAMTGATEYGPWPYLANNATMLPTPSLVTSFTEYERAFGGLTIDGEPCQLALAARAFFTNGGRRLYVARVVSPAMTAGPQPEIDVAATFGSLSVPAQGQALLTWKARWPGSLASRINVVVSFRRSKNVLVAGRLTGVRPGAAVEVVPLDNGRPPVIDDDVPPGAADVRIVAEENDTLGYVGANGAFEAVAPGTAAFHITLAVQVTLGDRVDVYNELELGEKHRRSIFSVLEAEDPADEFSLVWLDRVDQQGGPDPTPGELLEALLSLAEGAWMTGGGDGNPLSADDLNGNVADPDNVNRPARGLGDRVRGATSPTLRPISQTRTQSPDRTDVGHCSHERPRDRGYGRTRASRHWNVRPAESPGLPGRRVHEAARRSVAESARTTRGEDEGPGLMCWSGRCNGPGSRAFEAHQAGAATGPSLEWCSSTTPVANAVAPMKS